MVSPVIHNTYVFEPEQPVDVMHPSAIYYAKLFFDTYVTSPAETRILDIGSQNVNGSLREVAPKEIKYVGVDMESGDGVDIVLTDPYSLPFPDESFDVVLSSSCFEHSEFFWVLFTEALRVLKPHGILYINAPSNGKFHRYPVDCWRFYPDSGRALANWARRCGLRTELLESFVGIQWQDIWNDFVAVFLKDESHSSPYRRRMIEQLRDFENGVLNNEAHVLHWTELPEDMRAADGLRKAVGKLQGDMAGIQAELTQESLKLRGEIEELQMQAEAARISAEEELKRKEAARIRVEEELKLKEAAWIKVEDELRDKGLLIEEQSGRLAALHSDSRKLRDTLDTSEKLLAYAVERYGSAIRRRWLRAVLRRLRLVFHKLPVARSAYRSVRDSVFFEKHFYLARNLDVGASGIDPVVHYLKWGSQEGRSPSPFFSEVAYRGRYPDVVASGLSAIEHYERYGRTEGRSLSRFNSLPEPSVMPQREPAIAAPMEPDPPWTRLLDAEWYLAQYPDVAATGMSALDNFMRHGAPEGRNPNEYFDASWYLERNPDVRAARVEPLKHYIEHGWKEGRDPGPKFSVKNYLELYRDVQGAGLDPLEHYIRYGRSEGRLIGESYSEWIAKYDTIDDKARGSMVKRIAQFASLPKFSVIMPVYNTGLQWLREAIESVRAQLYSNWELCISDNASTLPGIKELLREYADKDKRILVVFRDTNGHISANSNSALSVATGDFDVLMDSDDILPEDALFWVAEEINAHPDVDLIYSDEDKVDIEGSRYEPYFKSDWNPALILSQNMFSHLGVYRHSLVEKVGGFRLGLEGSQDHDLVLRCADATEASRIRHIPHILYHWRAVPESMALSTEAKPYAWNAGARAIGEHLARNGVKATVTNTPASHYQVNYGPPTDWPKVSIIMPSGCKLELLRPCLSDLLARTTYPNFEVLLAVNEIRFKNNEQAACLNEFAKDQRVRLIVYKDREFNFSWIINWATKQASGSVLCLMNDDVKIITTDWLEKLVVRLQLNRVGAVGVMLYYPDETIQHAGVILGLGGVSGNPFNRLTRGSEGYFNRATLEQDLSCVTAACIAVRRMAFEDLNGFDERLAVAFNDVDFCIRLREKGWRIIWTPFVEHYHLESQTVGQPDSVERAAVFQKEIRMMREKWGPVLDSDPFYNPNLSLKNDRMGLAFPPRAPKSVIAAKWPAVATTGNSTAGSEHQGGEKCARYRLDSVASLSPNDNVLIYVAYCADGSISPFQARSIDLYASYGYRVILVVNSGAYDRVIDPGRSAAFFQIVREDIGFDFGGWSHTVRLIEGLDAVRSVTLTNDSLIGPLEMPRATPLRKVVEEVESDVVFLTECHERHKHFQTYFFTLKHSALSKGALSVLARLPYLNDKRRVIEEYEVPLAWKFEALGLSTAAAFATPLADAARTNPTIRFWRELCASGFPFVKASLITEGHVGYGDPVLQAVVDTNWRELLEDHLRHRGNLGGN